MEKSDLKEAVEEAVAAVFASRDVASDLARDTHSEHHQWLRERILRESEKAEFWRNLKVKSLPWIIVAGAGWLATSIWAFVTTYISVHWK